jgi:hypothetical protein
MAEQSNSLPGGVSTHQLGVPEFVGQQTGVAAELLHNEFRKALVALPQVERAYFCKLRYSGADRGGAAVCVASSGGEDRQIVEALAAVIRANLGLGFHIDILFLSPVLEGQLARICQPFYKQAELGAAPNGSS